MQKIKYFLFDIGNKIAIMIYPDDIAGNLLFCRTELAPYQPVIFFGKGADIIQV